MKLLSWIILIVILGLFLKSSYPDTYNQTFGKTIEQAQAVWEARSDTFLDNLQNYNEVSPDGQVSSPPSGTIYGRPWDEVINRFDCTSDAQCQQRFSVTAICNNQTGECYEA